MLTLTMEALRLNVKNYMQKYIYILFISVLLLFQKQIQAQQLPIYSQYMFNDYLINSAYAGTYAFTPIILNHRNQWVGFGESAPQTSSISIHGSAGKNSAFGGSMLFDKTHPISQTQLELSYAYHTIMNEQSRVGLSMSLGGTYNMKQFVNENNTTYSEITNNQIDAVSQDENAKPVGDINFGLILFTDYFDLGVSIRNLLAPENTNALVSDEIDRTKYIIVHGSYLGRNNPKSPFAMIPSFVIRKMGLTSYNNLFEVDLNLKLVYRNKFWAGAGFRTHEKAICTLIGFNTNKAYFGWSYDIGTAGIGQFHNGSHNIAIGLKLGVKKKNNIKNQTPFDMNIDESPRKINLRLSDMRHKSGI